MSGLDALTRDERRELEDLRAFRRDHLYRPWPWAPHIGDCLTLRDHNSRPASTWRITRIAPVRDVDTAETFTITITRINENREAT